SPGAVGKAFARPWPTYRLPSSPFSLPPLLLPFFPLPLWALPLCSLSLSTLPLWALPLWALPLWALPLWALLLCSLPLWALPLCSLLLWGLLLLLWAGSLTDGAPVDADVLVDTDRTAVLRAAGAVLGVRNMLLRSDLSVSLVPWPPRGLSVDGTDATALVDTGAIAARRSVGAGATGR